MSTNMIESEEAIRLYVEAGFSANTFYRHARDGKIRKTLPEIRERGALYNESDIKRIIGKKTGIGERGKVDREERKEIATEVAWQKTSDLPAILKLDLLAYKDDLVGDIGLYISWAKKNTKITLLSFESGKRENVLAYISLVPLPEDIIVSILKGEREELSINADEIESYERKGAYTLLAESIVIHPDHPEQLNKVLGAVLNHWCKQYPDRYIEKIYADAATDHGDMLARKLFFSPLYAVSDRAYVLDLRKPGISKVVKRFQECLDMKSRENESEDAKRGRVGSSKDIKARHFEVVQAKTEDDIKATVEIARQHFGDRAYSLEKRLAWHSIVPNGDYVLKHNSTIVAYFSMQPLKKEAINRIFEPKSNGSVQLDDMLPLAPGEPLECYVSGIGIINDTDRQHAKTYGQILLLGLFRTMENLGKQGIEIHKIWGMSGTVSGIKLSRDMGFTELDYINNEQIGFVLDMDPKKADNPIIKIFLRRYKDALQSAKRK